MPGMRLGKRVPQYRWLRENALPNPLYEKVLSYGTYRLEKFEQERSSR